MRYKEKLLETEIPEGYYNPPLLYFFIEDKLRELGYAPFEVDLEECLGRKRRNIMTCFWKDIIILVDDDLLFILRR